MKLKELEPGDSVRVKYTTTVFDDPITIYIDGKLIKLDDADENHPRWLVEYQLEPVFGAPKYQNWWYEDDIASKHHVRLTDQEHFDRAEKISISDYKGVLFYNDYYFESVNEILDYCECEEIDPPKFVWACDTTPVSLGLDLESHVSECMEEDGYEGMSESTKFDHLFDKLKFIQDEFVKAAAKETVSYPNYKAVIL